MRGGQTLITNRLSVRTTLVAFILVIFFNTVSSIWTMPSTASALNGSQFSAGRIIDDVVFYNSNAMTANQIQTLLNSKLPSCDTNGTKSYSYHYRASPLRINDSRDPWVTTTRAVYGQRVKQRDGDWKGSAAPYSCLRDFKMDTVDIPPESGLCSGYIGANNETAAQIIYKASKSCGINPQVMLVTLQKEQSLVTDDWPWGVQLKKATGVDCPDNPPSNWAPYNCKPSSLGFFKQVYYSAHRFKWYRLNADNYQYRAGRNNTIYWHPNTGCGTSNVYIQNQATAALYIYTPYRPNQAALNNLYGTGDSCSSYGNRNFWRMFNDWFGSTLAPWKPLDVPRWMETKTDTYKRNPSDGTRAEDATIPAGTQIFFESKITIDGTVYVRSKYSHDRAEAKAFLLSDLKEIGLDYLPMDVPRWMEVGPGEVRKTDPRTGKSIYDVIPEGYQAYFDERITIGGTLYLRTKTDKMLGRDRLIAYSSLQPTIVEYEDFDRPRWMQISKETREYNIKERVTSGSTIPQGTQLFLNTKMVVNGAEYYRNNRPGNVSYHAGIPANDIVELSVVFESLEKPRAFRLKNSTYKQDPVTGSNIEVSIDANSIIYFPTKTTIGGTLYFRSLYDTRRGQLKVMPASAFEEIPVAFEAMIKPRELITTKATFKKDPVTLQNIETLSKNTRIAFSERIVVEGQLYLRTKYNKNNNQLLVVPFNDLREP